MANHIEFCAFWIGQALFGIDVMQVQEIVSAQRETPIPQSSPVIRGLINLRGQVVTVIDLRTCLNLPACTDDENAVYIVIRYGKERFCLRVDRMMGVLDDCLEMVERPNELNEKQDMPLIGRVYRHVHNLLLELNIDQVLAMAKS